MAKEDKVVAEEKETTFPISDIAIDAIEEDEFGFAEQAGRLARLVAGENSPENIAVGVSGSWGSGKSSMLNLIKCYLEKEGHYLEIFRQDYPEGTEDKEITKKMPIVVEFDPWFFGSEEKIIDAFFLRLAKSITNNGKTRKGTGKFVWWLSQAFKATENILPVIKGAGELTEKIADEILGNNNKDFFEIKKELSKNLKKMKKRIVILIDDMDRLQADEILTMLKIIRLVTDLPKINTVIAFDHEVTANIINDKVGGDGLTYMQKMVNVPTYLPKVTIKGISDYCMDKLFYIAKKFESDVISKNGMRVTMTYSLNFLIGRELISTVREIKNILNIFEFGIAIIGNKVDFWDFFGLCVLFYFYPKIFDSFFSNNFPFTFVDEIVCITELSQQTKEKICDRFNVEINSPIFRYLQQFVKPIGAAEWNGIAKEIDDAKKSIRHQYNHKKYFGLFPGEEMTLKLEEKEGVSRIIQDLKAEKGGGMQ